ncbi:MAG TPA: ribbon-helix-helix protein, CopG family [Gammaproteobacteria bacterium]|nr:ribbon-helix-helix protein, CopG family [Gammaproteobacteria bacterium]
MATSVHLPKELLDAVDRKARALRISRNQLIVRALEREISAGSEWSPGFSERLAERDPDTARDVDELLAGVVAARRSKRATPL